VRGEFELLIRVSRPGPAELSYPIFVKNISPTRGPPKILYTTKSVQNLIIYKKHLGHLHL
jgi:hypothetical protein